MPGLPWLSPARLVLLVAALVTVYLSFSAVNTLVQAHHLNHQEQTLRADVARLKSDDQRLSAISGYLQSDEYIESVARRRLGLVHPGDTLVVVSSTAPDTPTPEPSPAAAPGETPRWWERLFGP